MNTDPRRFQRFGNYVLLHLTGAGGMGRVDVALAPRAGGMERLCVLKRMRGDLRTPEQTARFRREATIAIGLSHGAIAQTLDVEEIEGELCILQEFVHGTNLAQLEHRAAAHEPLPLPLSVHVAREVTRAIAYAHSFNTVGIVHRDITPDNIMLSFTGEVKLVDFGIAKPVGDRSLTSVGVVVGRPLYTAPEVVAGGEADKRSDIYSIGVVLWQLLTGGSFPDPFEQGTPPVPSSVNSAIPSALDLICMRAVALRPEGRFQTATQLLDALTNIPGLGVAHDRTLAEFLGRHFDVPEEQRQLSADMGTARLRLNEARPAGLPELTDQPGLPGPPPSRRRSRLLRTLTLTLAGAAISVSFWRFWRPSAVSNHHATTAPPIPSPREATIVHMPIPVPRESMPTGHPAGQPPGRERAATPSPVRRAVAPVPAADAEALLHDAARYYKAGDLDRAFDMARSAARVGGGADAHLIMGKVLFTRDNLPGAESEFKEAAKLKPDDAEANRYLHVLRQEARRGPP